MEGKVEQIIKIGDRRRIAEALVQTLADTFTLAMKVQAFSWNISGPFAAALRPMLQEQFRDLATTIDEMAIRIRVLGLPAPSAFSQFASLSGVKEEGDVPDWREMVRQLVDDQDIVAKSCGHAHSSAELFNDTATLDLMARRITRHERNGWELRALLD